MNKAEKENSVCEEENISPVAVPCIRLGIIRPDPVTPLKVIKASYLGKLFGLETYQKLKN